MVVPLFEKIAKYQNAGPPANPAATSSCGRPAGPSCGFRALSTGYGKMIPKNKGVG